MKYATMRTYDVTSEKQMFNGLCDNSALKRNNSEKRIIIRIIIIIIINFVIINLLLLLLILLFMRISRPPKVQLQSNTTQLSSIKLNLKNKIYSTYACINTNSIEHGPCRAPNNVSDHKENLEFRGNLRSFP